MGRLMTLLLALTASLVAAGERHVDDETVRALREAGDILPLTAIVERAEGRWHGTLLEVELERRDGRLVYEVEYLDDAGVVHEALFDARTGAWLETISDVDEDHGTVPADGD